MPQHERERAQAQSSDTTMGPLLLLQQQCQYVPSINFMIARVTDVPGHAMRPGPARGARLALFITKTLFAAPAPAKRRPDEWDIHQE
jgi:hypothetical protein